MPAEAVAGAFISGVTKFVFDTLRDRINRKEKAQRERDLETFRSEARLRETERESLVRRYPFGEHGRLKNFYRVDQRPCVLISPLRSALVDAPGIGKTFSKSSRRRLPPRCFLQTTPDATVQGCRRTASCPQLRCRGSRGTRIPPSTCVDHSLRRTRGGLRDGRYCTFLAALSDDALETAPSRPNSRGSTSRPADGGRTAWSPQAACPSAQIDLPRATDERMHVIASHVALFAAAVLDLYWKERGTESGLFDALRAAEPHGAQTPRATAPSFETRVAAELEGLKRAQFAVSRESLAGGGCRLTVPLQSQPRSGRSAK